MNEYEVKFIFFMLHFHWPTLCGLEKTIFRLINIDKYIILGFAKKKTLNNTMSKEITPFVLYTKCIELDIQDEIK